MGGTLHPLHSYSHLGFAGTVPGPDQGWYAHIHACLMGPEEAVSGEKESELAAIQVSSASQISCQAAVALQKWHGMCSGGVCVRELASKGQLQWKRGISLCVVYGDKLER